jgi:2-dehydro-3-deoxyphosphooctonate aldolase (KDO 8-P synthase)
MNVMKNNKTVKVKNVVFGGDELPLIAGPCVIESRDHALKMAEAISVIARQQGFPYVFKSSFDKANRTSPSSYRGPGIDAGLEILQDIKKNLDVPILTDVHLPEQAELVADVVDIIQVPAFLCRQTDILKAVAETGKPVNVKKGQFLSPWKMNSVVEKLVGSGATAILLTERGSTYGYENLVVDMRSIPIMQETGCPVVFDATHSAQVPGITGDSTGGMRKYIPAVLKAAVAAGCNGLFMEVHDDVENARSDAATQWPLDKLGEILTLAGQIHRAVVVDE